MATDWTVAQNRDNRAGRGERPMRIALVTPRYLPQIGGVEIHVGHLARRLAAAGHSVDVLTHATPGLSHLDEADGTTVRRFPIRLGGRTYPFAPGLWNYIGRHSLDYDVVHIHNYHATPAIPAALAPVKRLVFTPHYLGGGRTAIAQALHRPYRSIGRLLFHRADHVVCTTVAEAEMVASDFPNAARKTIVIPNGIDVDLINGAAPQRSGGPVVLYAGRLEKYKNIQLVVSALPYLGNEVRLAIVGEGPSYKDLTLLAADLGVASRVELVGAVAWPAVYRWFRAADVFVTMSARESFGMSLLEAYVAGAQLVASDIPAHREVAAMAGLRSALVPLTAAPGELAAAIRIALASPRPVVHNVPSWYDHVDSLLRLYMSDGTGTSHAQQRASGVGLR
jgi:glycosyltransferase involved in cell wall biosynthesis